MWAGQLHEKGPRRLRPANVSRRPSAVTCGACRDSSGCQLWLTPHTLKHCEAVEHSTADLPRLSRLEHDGDRFCTKAKQCIRAVGDLTHTCELDGASKGSACAPANCSLLPAGQWSNPSPKCNKDHPALRKEHVLTNDRALAAVAAKPKCVQWLKQQTWAVPWWVG